MLYLCGPMRGIEHFNYPAFNDMEETLVKSGYDVWNPARHHYAYEVGGIEGCLALDFQVLISLCHDGVVVLDGWESSFGARAEAFTAWALGRPVYRWFKSDLEEITADEYFIRK